jgi:uncharacterized membrane protein
MMMDLIFTLFALLGVEADPTTELTAGPQVIHGG